jgi:hypothetical protein
VSTVESRDPAGPRPSFLPLFTSVSEVPTAAERWPHCRLARVVRCGDDLRGKSPYTVIGVLAIIGVLIVLVLLILASIHPRFPQELL